MSTADADRQIKCLRGVYFLTRFKESDAAIISDIFVPAKNATTEVWQDGKLVRIATQQEGTHD